MKSTNSDPSGSLEPTTKESSQLLNSLPKPSPRKSLSTREAEVDEEEGVEEDEEVDEVVEEGVDEVEGVDVMVVTGITGTRRNPRVCPPASVPHRWISSDRFLW
jgi:hypothetical protein